LGDLNPQLRQQKSLIIRHFNNNVQAYHFQYAGNWDAFQQGKAAHDGGYFRFWNILSELDEPVSENNLNVSKLFSYGPYFLDEYGLYVICRIFAFKRVLNFKWVFVSGWGDKYTFYFNVFMKIKISGKSDLSEALRSAKLH
jgi:hypothetical protein